MSTWTTFGSIMHHTKPRGTWPSGTTQGHNDRGGVRYQWVFDAASGRFACIVKVDGDRVR